MQGLTGRIKSLDAVGRTIVKPIFESKDDLEVIYRIAKKCGFADRMFKNIKVETTCQWPRTFSAK